MSNLVQRVITGIIGGALMVGMLVWNAWSLFFLLSVLGIAGQLEFYRLLKENEEEPMYFWGLAGGIGLHIVVFLYSSGCISGRWFLVFFPFSSFIYFVELYRKTESPFENVAYTIQGIMYVSLPFALLYLPAFQDGVFCYEVILGCFLLLWTSDSGAYFAGKSLGRSKLFERISPKKTWEGSLGGAACTLVLAWGLSVWFPVFPLWKWGSLAIIIVVAGTMGDLVESMFKRSLQIKDSGNLIPGHGGILDRFDGMLLAAPFIVSFLLLTD